MVPAGDVEGKTRKRQQRIGATKRHCLDNNDTGAGVPPAKQFHFPQHAQGSVICIPRDLESSWLYFGREFDIV